LRIFLQWLAKYLQLMNFQQSNREVHFSKIFRIRRNNLIYILRYPKNKKELIMNKKVMIIEDQEDLLEIIADSIKDFGYDVEKATSAEMAFEIIEKERIKVQLVDLQLPGMSGIEYCRKIREDDSISVMYAMTGFASVFHLMECRQVGFDDYFIKPVKLELLKRSLDDAFEKLGRWKKGK